MEIINTFLSGMLMPALLIGTGIWFAVRLRFFYIFHPIRFCRTLAQAHKGGGVSPFRALSQALAGTLGVGNMAGVATAIVAGGHCCVWQIRCLQEILCRCTRQLLFFRGCRQ